MNDNTCLSLPGFASLKRKAKFDRCTVVQRQRMDPHTQYYLCLGITDHCAGDTWRGDSWYALYTSYCSLTCPGCFFLSTLSIICGVIHIHSQCHMRLLRSRFLNHFKRALICQEDYEEAINACSLYISEK